MKARLGLIYFAIFSFVGIHMPFWPVWLKSKGIDSLGIAALTALSFALKIVVTPIVSKIVDANGKKRAAIIWLSLGLLVGCSVFFVTSGFVQIFILTTLAFSCWSPIMSLAECVTMAKAKAHRLDYGRIRLWGSISFILVAMFSGRLLARFGEPVLLWSICGAAALLFIAACLLPKTEFVPAKAKKAGAAIFLNSRWFVWFLCATMLIQGSHATYYVFSSLHWRTIGLSDQVIGLLWGASLAAEIAFFALGRPVVDRLGPINVIIIGGVAAGLRWIAVAYLTDPILLALAQLLHAFSFGASHFAAVRLISEKVDESLSASGQGIYSAFVMGIGMGVFVLLSGPLYKTFGHHSFAIMSLVSVLGTAAIFAVRRYSITRIAQPVEVAPMPAGSYAQA